MTKRLTKPIRAIHFMVLAFLMTLSSSVMAQNWQKGLDAFEAGDYATALKEFRPLAEQGDADGLAFLARMYREGKGVLQDYAEAAKLFRLAAQQGDAPTILPQLSTTPMVIMAQFNLAHMYEEGKGVLQDNVMAHMWFNIASANGNEKSGEWRDEIANKMTPAAIEKAQAMARECMSSGYQNCGY